MSEGLMFSLLGAGMVVVPFLVAKWCDRRRK